MNNKYTMSQEEVAKLWGVVNCMSFSEKCYVQMHLVHDSCRAIDIQS